MATRANRQRWGSRCWRHYIQTAATWNHWFQLAVKRIEHFATRYGDDFCIVLNGSEEPSDVYVIPYAVLRPLLRTTTPDRRRRWVGRIVNGELRLNGVARGLPMQRFHRALELLLYAEDNAA
jgi:hypothetical protein